MLHAVAIARDLYGRRVIFDHEIADVLPFSREGLDACWASGRTVIGLGEVMLVEARGVAGREVDERSSWGIQSL